MLEGAKENKIEGKVSTTCAIILNSKGEILLVKRAETKGRFGNYWALPSGIGFSKSKHGLSPDKAVIKEVGADVGTQSFVGKRIFSEPINDNPKTNELIVYVGNVTESEIRIMQGETQEFKWMKAEQAMQEKLAFQGNEVVEKYLKSIKG